jgi:hypothetical protein
VASGVLSDLAVEVSVTAQLPLRYETRFLATVSPLALEAAVFVVTWSEGRAVFVQSATEDGGEYASERASDFARRRCGIKSRLEADGTLTELARFMPWRMQGGVPKTTRRGGPRQMRRRA